MKRDLDRYWRTHKPDLEVAPRQPVSAVRLAAPTGRPFTLVREAVGRDDIGDSHGIAALAWCLWMEEGWAGYIGTNVPLAGVVADGLRATQPIRSRREALATSGHRSVAAYRCWLTDGKHPEYAPASARGQGLMYTAYAHLIGELSEIGWTLSSGYAARNTSSRAMWRRLRETNGIEIVRSTSKRREFAYSIKETP